MTYWGISYWLSSGLSSDSEPSPSRVTSVNTGYAKSVGHVRHVWRISKNVWWRAAVKFNQMSDEKLQMSDEAQKVFAYPGEHHAAQIRNSNPTLEIWAELCSHWRLRSSSAQKLLSPAPRWTSVKCPIVFRSYFELSREISILLE